MHPVNILTRDVVKNENARSCIKKYLYNVEKPQKKRERELKNDTKSRRNFKFQLHENVYSG